MKNRIFFVTSPLQILNTKSAIDNLGGERDIYKDYVIIIHSSLTNFLKKIVKYYAKKCMEIIYIIFIFNNGCLRSNY